MSRGVRAIRPNKLRKNAISKGCSPVLENRTPLCIAAKNALARATKMKVLNTIDAMLAAMICR